MVVSRGVSGNSYLEGFLVSVGYVGTTYDTSGTNLGDRLATTKKS
jgi:hypothetical protein